ncbi:MAG: radical SAM protein [Candidatus Absconditabacterales bacterium]
MIKTQEITAKTIITPSKLPGADFVINPYIGCSHGCNYCYANFMRKFTGHIQDNRGEFVDIKTNSADVIKNITKYAGKRIVIGSVTDPYQAIEEQYQITRNILKKLLEIPAQIDIITKSKLVTRDIDLLKQIKNINVTTSFCTNDEQTKKLFEKDSPPLHQRKESLEKLHESGIHTTLFISPLLPEITKRKDIINETKAYVDEYRFENLNLYPSIKTAIYQIISKIDPTLPEKYKEIYEEGAYEEYRNKVAGDIQQFCQNHGVKYTVYFHHKDIKKK